MFFSLHLQLQFRGGRHHQEAIFNGQPYLQVPGIYYESATPSLSNVTYGVYGANRLQVPAVGGKLVFDASSVGKRFVLHQASTNKDYFFTVCGVECESGVQNFLYFNEALVDEGDTPIYVSDEDRIVSAEGGMDGRDIYATLVLGENAYGTTEITGGGLEYIVKQLGSGGTADPLNQRATVGWKATKAAVRLMEPFMVRIETASSFTGGAN